MFCFYIFILIQLRIKRSEDRIPNLKKILYEQGWKRKSGGGKHSIVVQSNLAWNNFVFSNAKLGKSTMNLHLGKNALT